MTSGDMNDRTFAKKDGFRESCVGDTLLLSSFEGWRGRGGLAFKHAKLLEPERWKPQTILHSPLNLQPP